MTATLHRRFLGTWSLHNEHGHVIATTWRPLRPMWSARAWAARDSRCGNVYVVDDADPNPFSVGDRARFTWEPFDGGPGGASTVTVVRILGSYHLHVAFDDGGVCEMHRDELEQLS